MEKENKFISAVVYMYNEQKNIQNFIKCLHHYLSTRFAKYEIICVDDASSDESVSRVKDIVKNEKLANVSLISMDIYQGRELAMEAGVDLSIGDYVYELEWIDMYDPEHYEDVLWKAYVTALQGYDIVSCPSVGPKTASTSIFYKIYNNCSLSYIPLVPERFRIVTRRAINRVSRMNKTIVYRKALYANCGLKGTILGIPESSRNDTQKNVKRNKSKLGTTVLLSYTAFYQKIASAIGGVLIINLFFSIINFLYQFIINEGIGILSEIWLLNSFFAIIIGSMLGIALKYLELILELVLKKENYVVGSVDKLVNSEK